MPESFDVIIIGSGQAGNPLATAFAQEGRRVALIEKNLLGGSCINYGCVPTKTLLASAERAHHAYTDAQYGIEVELEDIDLPTIVERKDALLEKLRQGIHENLTDQENPVQLFDGHASFTAPHTLNVTLNTGGTETLTAPLIFINTGTRAAIPEIDGLADTDFLTPTTILNLKDKPEHLIIIGGGYIGLEFSQLYRRLGCEVTIVEESAVVLEREDDDVCEAMQQLLEGEGVQFLLGSQAHRVSQNAEKQFTVSVTTPDGERRLRGSHVLVAVGREPNTKELGLDKAGVETDDRGFVLVDDQFHTNVRGIYALGDVHGGPQFTHISYDDYRIVRDNILKGKKRSKKGRDVPYVVFTEPQLGRIGLSEHEAQEQKLDYRVASMPVKTIGRAQQTGLTKGFIKVLVDGKTDCILGTAVFCEQGGEIMSMLQLAMHGNITCEMLQDMIFAHPTWAEALNNLFSKLENPKKK
ncbi:mercuric reductase [Hymenobacter aerilatus]|uniref:Mercuric reductase n=1 Tax=Hymenobacter aerilatus TaxID=2932251 RepID=A0A8T9SPU5_9BACT|nr:mercuric reductase [Hymenobacter aerilatus]UOR04092.1 mercuric reductase [Hymenobacter aerilatus]